MKHFCFFLLLIYMALGKAVVRMKKFIHLLLMYVLLAIAEFLKNGLAVSFFILLNIFRF